jgi:hypothetical protein
MNMDDRHHTTDRNVRQEVSLQESLNQVRRWIAYLRSNYLVILLVTLLGLAGGLAFYFIEKPVYVADFNFVLEEQSSSGGMMGQYSGLASMVGIDLGGGGGGIFDDENLPELYKSRTMIKKTLLTNYDFDGRKELLIERYLVMKNLRDKWKTNPALANINFEMKNGRFSRVQDSVIRTVVKDIGKNYLVVEKPDKKLSIINVEVKAKDELFAMAFANQIVENVNEFYVYTKTKKSSDNLAILQRQTDSVKRELGIAISNVAASVDINPNANLARQILMAPSKRRQVDVQANTAILTELVKNLEISKLTLRKETPLIQTIDEPQLPLDVQVVGKKAIVIGAVLGFVLIVMVLTIRLIIRSFT